MEKEVIPCVCLTCGVRNNFSTENGFCQNGHDDWLEYRDVFLLEDAPKETVDQAMKLFHMDLKTLQEKFVDTSIKQFDIMKTTEEKNRIVGNFLEVKFYEETGHYFDVEGAFIGVSLTFDSDYDLLFESVEKIEELEDGRFDVNILKYGTQVIDYTNGEHIVIDNVADVNFEKKIDHIFDAVVKFIEWYNEQMKP